MFQDVRGRFQSEGGFVEMRPHIERPAPVQTDESTDMFDTVEWLLKNVRSNNGKVGIWGMSYPGFYTSASIIDSHPAIKAASPQAPMTTLFLGDDSYHNGAFMTRGAVPHVLQLFQASRRWTRAPVFKDRPLLRLRNLRRIPILPHPWAQPG
ncbi:MAG: CocE/NonD family hydrolase [Bryobacteraceae bacterium]